MKIAAIIQARLTSTRLPNKVLMEIGGGKSTLWHVVDRLKASKKVNDIVLAIPDTEQNDPLEEFAQDNGIKCFRGSEDDVLARYYAAAKKFKSDVIIRVTSDCPLIDPVIVDICVNEFLNGSYDYVSNCYFDESDFPRGLDVRVMSFKALQKAFFGAAQSYEREHVAPYIWENKKNEFKIGPTVKALSGYSGNYRLTIDYQEDIDLIKKIYSIFYKPGLIIDTREVISYLSGHPDVAMINAKCQQKLYKPGA